MYEIWVAQKKFLFILNRSETTSMGHAIFLQNISANHASGWGVRLFYNTFLSE